MREQQDMKILIVEDELPAYNRVVQLLHDSGDPVEVMGHCTSIKATVEWLSGHDDPELIMMDIELTDGIFFPIFQQVELRSPVIFFTRPNEYFPDALEHSFIDLLKLVDGHKFMAAIEKYRKLQKHFIGNMRPFTPVWTPAVNRKEWVVIKKGNEYQTKKLTEIAYFFSEQKLVFLVDSENKKYVTEKESLYELAAEIPGDIFFRANRKYIINVNFIKGYRTVDRVKIGIELHLPTKEAIVVSQQKTYEFKRWIGQI